MAAVTGPDARPPARDPRDDRHAGPADAPAAITQPVLPDELVRSICPYFGTGAGWRLAVPDRAHRCLAVTPPTMLALEKQSRLCLGPAHLRCATYLAAVEASEPISTVEVRAAESPDAETGRRRRWAIPRTQATVLDVGRGSVDFGSVARQRATTQVALVALALLAFGALFLARFAGLSATGAETPGASRAATLAVVGATSTSAPLAGDSAAPTISPAPSATASHTPTAPSPSVPPSASASTIPGETPAASFRLYTVRSGDTLGAIARQFGTSVAAIEAANGIADPRRIQIGQVLRIPG